MENIRTTNQRNVPIQVLSYEMQTNRNHRSSLWEMCFLATEQLADSEDFNFFNHHYTFRWEKKRESRGPDRQFVACTFHFPGVAVWGNMSSEVHPAGPLKPVHLLTPLSPLPRFFFFFNFFFSERGDPVRHLLLLYTASKLIKKREERSNNTPRSPQRRENFRQPRKAFPRVGRSWPRLPAAAPPRPAASPGSRPEPRRFACSGLQNPWASASIAHEKTNGRAGKGKKTPFLCSRNSYRAFSPHGENRWVAIRACKGEFRNATTVVFISRLCSLFLK